MINIGENSVWKLLSKKRDVKPLESLRDDKTELKITNELTLDRNGRITEITAGDQYDLPEIKRESDIKRKYIEPDIGKEREQSMIEQIVRPFEFSVETKSIKFKFPVTGAIDWDGITINFIVKNGNANNYLQLDGGVESIIKEIMIIYDDNDIVERIEDYSTKAFISRLLTEDKRNQYLNKGTREILLEPESLGSNIVFNPSKIPIDVKKDFNIENGMINLIECGYLSVSIPIKATTFGNLTWFSEERHTNLSLIDNRIVTLIIKIDSSAFFVPTFNSSISQLTSFEVTNEQVRSMRNYENAKKKLISLTSNVSRDFIISRWEKIEIEKGDSIASISLANELLKIFGVAFVIKESNKTTNQVYGIDYDGDSKELEAAIHNAIDDNSADNISKLAAMVKNVNIYKNPKSDIEEFEKKISENVENFNEQGLEPTVFHENENNRNRTMFLEKRNACYFRLITIEKQGFQYILRTYNKGEANCKSYFIGYYTFDELNTILKLSSVRFEVVLFDGETHIYPSVNLFCPGLVSSNNVKPEVSRDVLRLSPVTVFHPFSIVSYSKDLDNNEFSDETVHEYLNYTELLPDAFQRSVPEQFLKNDDSVERRVFVSFLRANSLFSFVNLNYLRGLQLFTKFTKEDTKVLRNREFEYIRLLGKLEIEASSVIQHSKNRCITGEIWNIFGVIDKRTNDSFVNIEYSEARIRLLIQTIRNIKDLERPLKYSFIDYFSKVKEYKNFFEAIIDVGGNPVKAELFKKKEELSRDDKAFVEKIEDSDIGNLILMMIITSSFFSSAYKFSSCNDLLLVVSNLCSSIDLTYKGALSDLSNKLGKFVAEKKFKVYEFLIQSFLPRVELVFEEIVIEALKSAKTDNSTINEFLRDFIDLVGNKSELESLFYVLEHVSNFGKGTSEINNIISILKFKNPFEYSVNSLKKGALINAEIINNYIKEMDSSIDALSSLGRWTSLSEFEISRTSPINIMHDLIINEKISRKFQMVDPYVKIRYRPLDFNATEPRVYQPVIRRIDRFIYDGNETIPLLVAGETSDMFLFFTGNELENMPTYRIRSLRNLRIDDLTFIVNDKYVYPSSKGLGKTSDSFGNSRYLELLSNVLRMDLKNTRINNFNYAIGYTTTEFITKILTGSVAPQIFNNATDLSHVVVNSEFGYFNEVMSGFMIPIPMTEFINLYNEPIRTLNLIIGGYAKKSLNGENLQAHLYSIS